MATYDLAVIGAGAAGLTAAGSAAALGAKTILIEASRFGGDCTWSGCIPSKALLRAASLAASHDAETFGIERQIRVDGARVMARVRAVRQRIYSESDAPELLARYGFETLRGEARFIDNETLEIRGASPQHVTARRFIIATGSEPLSLDLGVPTVNPETIWDIETIPQRLLIIGGGPAAVEMAQAFGRLGAVVTVTTHGKRVLPRDTIAAADIVTNALRREGVGIRTECSVASASCTGGVIRATMSDGTVTVADLVFVAIGRRARVDRLGLEDAGVSVRDGLISVDAFCRTSAKAIYAAGDCATTAKFTHVAERMAGVAVMNAIAGLPTRFDSESVVWTTFTDPEVAQVGPTEADLARAGRSHLKETFPFSRLDRAIVDGLEDGFTSILTTRGGRVLGGTVVGPRSAELIAEIALARARRLPIAALAMTLHVYPSYAMGVRRAADAALVRKRTAFVLRALRLLRRLRGKAPPLNVLLP